MSGAPAHDEGLDELELLEWERMYSFLRTPSGPLAIIEVESSEHEADVLTAMGEVLSPEEVHVFRVRGEDDFRRPLDWLDEQSDKSGVFIVTDVPLYAEDEERTRDFWTWANAQRERWPREHGHVVFLLQPEQVDDLCRYAPMLWDWIPLKFNLIRRARAGERVPAAGQPYAAAIHEVIRRQDSVRADVLSQNLLAARLKSLREQLVRARQKGLPEHLIRRNFAWPLLKELFQQRQLADARHVLETELGYEFPTEMPDFQFFEARDIIQTLLARLGPERATYARRALDFHMLRGGALSRQVRGVARELLYMSLLLITSLCGDRAAAGDWVTCWAKHCERSGNDANAAVAYGVLGDFAMGANDYKTAEAWYRRALDTNEMIGNGEQASKMLSRLVAVELTKAGTENGLPARKRKRSQTAPHAPLKRMAKALLVRAGRSIEYKARKRWLNPSSS